MIVPIVTPAFTNTSYDAAGVAAACADCSVESVESLIVVFRQSPARHILCIFDCTRVVVHRVDVHCVVSEDCWDVSLAVLVLSAPALSSRSVYECIGVHHFERACMV